MSRLLLTRELSSRLELLSGGYTALPVSTNALCKPFALRLRVLDGFLLQVRGRRDEARVWDPAVLSSYA